MEFVGFFLLFLIIWQIADERVKARKRYNVLIDRLNELTDRIPGTDIEIEDEDEDQKVEPS